MAPVIVCAALNPALDVTYTVPTLMPGESHRVTDVVKRAGGKTVNSARILHALDVPSRLSAVRGGATGAAITQDLESAGLECEWVDMQAETRTSVAVVDARNATLFNEAGSGLRSAEWADFLSRVSSALSSGHVLLASGSLSVGAPDDAYGQLVKAAHHAQALSIIDTYGAWMAGCLSAHPSVVKLNHREASDLLALPISGPTQAANAVRELCARGARSAVVTLGGKGVVAGNEQRIVRLWSEQLIAGNPTGAGDSMTAGIAAGLAAGKDLFDALPMACALAAATVAAPVAGEFVASIVADQLPLIRFEEM